MGQKGTSPQHALAVIAEPLAVGRRVAVFGDASLGLDALLLEQGARAVTVFDPDAERARAAAGRAPRGASVRAYTADDPGPGSPETRTADVAIVPDLGAFADPADLVSRVRHMVGEYGAAILAASNREAAGAGRGARAFDYYELFDLVADEFHAVSMVAQLAFFGVALMELGAGGDDSSGVNVDTRLALAGRAPDAFVVVASQREERVLDPYSIVELPPPAAAAQPPARDDAALAALAEAQLRASVLESQLEEARARAVEGHRAVDALPALEREAGARARRVAELEERVAELEELEERRVAELEELEEEEAEPSAEAHAIELSRLEQALVERSQAVRALEGEIARRDRMIHDLVSALEDAGLEAPAAAPGAPPGDALVEADLRLRAQLDALALDLARREGEAHASAWKIDELERRLALSVSEPTDGGQLAGDAGKTRARGK